MSKIELLLIELGAHIFTIPNGPAFPIENRERTMDILRAMRGFLSEEGTTLEESNLLKEIGIMPK